MSDVTMRQLLEAGAHFGHQTRFWCPKMSPYIFGHRNKIHIINLEQTLGMFKDAMNYVGRVASERGSVMFVGTKRQASSIVVEEAQRAGCPYVYHRWLGGMLTNYQTVRKSIDRLTELDELMASPEGQALAKKEIIRLERERFRLNRNLAGIRSMERIPDVLFIIDVKHEKNAVLEARKLGIPVVAIVDTNCDPDGIDYVIPGNDDAISAIRLYCSAVADAVIEGKASSTERARTAEVIDVEAADARSNVDVSLARVTGAQAAVAPARDDDRRDGPPAAVQRPEPATQASSQADGEPAGEAETPAAAEPAAAEPAAGSE